jgi:hypothetical protein
LPSSIALHLHRCSLLSTYVVFKLIFISHQAVTHVRIVEVMRHSLSRRQQERDRFVGGGDRRRSSLYFGITKTPKLRPVTPATPDTDEMGREYEIHNFLHDPDKIPDKILLTCVAEYTFCLLAYLVRSVDSSWQTKAILIFCSFLTGV